MPTPRSRRQYESETHLLTDAVDPERSFVVVDDIPYDPRVGTDEFGAYEQTGRTLTGHEDAETFGFGVSDSDFDGDITVTSIEIVVTQVVADMQPCPWDCRYDCRDHFSISVPSNKI